MLQVQGGTPRTQAGSQLMQSLWWFLVVLLASGAVCLYHHYHQALTTHHPAVREHVVLEPELWGRIGMSEGIPCQVNCC